MAVIAQKWTDNCVYDHDAGSARTIPGRFSVGQNLAAGYSELKNYCQPSVAVMGGGAYFYHMTLLL